MFATLLGALPPPPHAEDIEAAIRGAIGAQEAAGLEPITDGRLWDPAFEATVAAIANGDAAQYVVERWRFAAGATERAVKQALPGPYSIGRRSADGGAAAAITMRAADSLRAVVEALAAAGCPMVEIEETEAHLIGDDPEQRELFRGAHQRLAGAVRGTHLSLSIVDGSAWEAGLQTIVELPYASLAVDLVAGPDNWNLVTRFPGDRGVIVGALPARDSPADAKEVLLWAARHAAGARGRGINRVGIGSAGSWTTLTWEAATKKMERLGEAARLAATPDGEARARSMDPRAVSPRAAATGRLAPRRPRRNPGEPPRERG